MVISTEWIILSRIGNMPEYHDLWLNMIKVFSTLLKKNNSYLTSCHSQLGQIKNTLKTEPSLMT